MHHDEHTGQFVGDGTSSLTKTSKSGSIKPRKKSIQLSSEEYGKVYHELNNNLTKEEREKGRIVRHIGDYEYTVINKGFNDYIVIGKDKIDGID